jgi:hypothetical protein
MFDFSNFSNPPISKMYYTVIISDDEFRPIEAADFRPE